MLLCCFVTFYKQIILIKVVFRTSDIVRYINLDRVAHISWDCVLATSNGMVLKPDTEKLIQQIQAFKEVWGHTGSSVMS
jgi:hypothetical protein